ncbi:hypothetical protein Hdeb2414_s0168g00821401 [Helianthus debilis subsp. tardiflorus]
MVSCFDCFNFLFSFSLYIACVLGLGLIWVRRVTEPVIFLFSRCSVLDLFVAEFLYFHEILLCCD